MNLGSRHGVGVGSADDVLGPVSVGANEDDFILKHLSVLENFFPSGRNKELVDGNCFIIEVGRTCETEDSSSLFGNAVPVARFFQHSASKRDGGYVLKLAPIIGGANDAIFVGPKVYEADSAGGVLF